MPNATPPTFDADHWGTPGGKNAARLLLLGAGELGKEVAIAAQRLGVEVIAADRYEDAPAMQVAHRSHVLDMLDAPALRALVEQERPTHIVPEIEAIATPELLRLEEEGWNVVPTARATRLTMDREGIRRLAAEELGLRTSPYHFVDDLAAFHDAIDDLGLPVVVKPVMSSSGKGQSLIREDHEIEPAWNRAQDEGRAGAGRVIVEGFVEFDYEITLLTVRHRDGTSFCAPIGHVQEDGDYRESWQPQPMSDKALAQAQSMARTVTDALGRTNGGWGLFGVELFVKGDDVIFSEISPRPHDTGLVTLISQNLNEFELHVRAILGLPVPHIEQMGPSASAVIIGEGHGRHPSFNGVADALTEANTDIRLFGKPEVSGKRRLGVALARGEHLQLVRRVARDSAAVTGVRIEK